MGAELSIQTCVATVSDEMNTPHAVHRHTQSCVVNSGINRWIWCASQNFRTRNHNNSIRHTGAMHAICLSIKRYQSEKARVIREAFNFMPLFNPENVTHKWYGPFHVAYFDWPHVFCVVKPSMNEARRWHTLISAYSIEFSAENEKY